MIPLCDELNKKVILITGGNKGIGGGCAEAFCASGADVVIAARDEDTGRTWAKELSRRGPGTCTFKRCDVSDHNQVGNLVDFTIKMFGKLDCTVNNAGYLPRRGPIDETSIEDFESVIRTNLIGLFAGCKYSLPHIRKTQGSIINISSILGQVGQKGSCMYAATKGAITSLTKSLAMDEAENHVRVNVILPGNIKTDLGKGQRDPEGLSGEASEKLSNHIQWIRRVGKSIEIGWIAVFLASSMASYITGAEINATGGFELGNGYRVEPDEIPKLVNGR